MLFANIESPSLSNVVSLPSTTYLISIVSISLWCEKNNIYAQIWAKFIKKSLPMSTIFGQTSGEFRLQLHHVHILLKSATYSGAFRPPDRSEATLVFYYFSDLFFLVKEERIFLMDSPFKAQEFQKQYGKEAVNIWKGIEHTDGTCTFNEAVRDILHLRKLHKKIDKVFLKAYVCKHIDLAHDF
jgi:hypothetical protein